MTNGRYVKVLGGKVGDRLAEIAADPGLHSLTEEVALTRMIALDAVALYGKAQDPQASPETKALAETVVRQAINDVASIVEKSLKVKTQSQELIRIDEFRFILGQVESIILRRLGKEAGDELVREIASQVRFQSEIKVEIE